MPWVVIDGRESSTPSGLKQAGIQKNEGHNLVVITAADEGDTARSSGWPGTSWAMMPPPAVILGTPVVPAEGETTGVSGIQRNKGNHLGTPAKHQQQDGLR